MIYVTKSYLPDLAEYTRLLEGVWERVHLTNDGPLVQQLEAELAEFLGVKHLFFASNGTIVLQMALKALGITGEVITTPFSYCATTNAIVWEGATPVFADIDPATLCIDATKIEALITERTQAIMATHVYGNACDVQALERIAQKHNLKVIYDAAHTFGATLHGRSLMSYGDVATCSFHATKVYHTVEGGCLVTNDDALADDIRYMRSFGHRNDDYKMVGVNAKNSEFHAAMGLCNLPRVPQLIQQRKDVSGWYDERLDFGKISRPALAEGIVYNYAYYPILLQSEERLLAVMDALKAAEVLPRRYFYPSLNTLPFLGTTQPCPVSEGVALRALCLPLYPSLPQPDVARITDVVNAHA